MKSAEIRQIFLDYFASKGHEIVPSSSLVPANDPTLLFTNAGMVQFKDTFLGGENRTYKTAVSSQRCVRAGGKHNDLENVGYTARHHTFFEMLGNFSFGDYFKRDAINFAWDFLTKKLGLPEEKLWVTVHISDDEAADIWIKEVGVSADRFSRLDEDNFWQMGDTGPCGPSSEIFYDHGEDVPGGPPGSEDDDLDRYIEIWNLVFMQYERSTNGDLTPLPNPSIDTGMGLERIAAVMQGVHTNYDIDLFQTLLKAAADIIGVKSLEEKSLRVIADHIRSCAFLVADGVLPGNEGRGYVLRRIIRRAIRHGHQLGAKGNFFYKMVSPLAEEMGAAYPELVELQQRIEKVLLVEEEQFAKTLDKGMAILESELENLSGEKIPGELVFKLYDTYGFPADLTNDIAREKKLTLDMDGFEQAMSEQKERARASGNFSVDYTEQLQLEGKTEFIGYDNLQSFSTVLEILKEGVLVDSLEKGEEGVIVLDKTPFYAESGGQVGDSGYLLEDAVRFEVKDTVKVGEHYLHQGVLLEGVVKKGLSLNAEVNSAVRKAITLNHSATHLLHAALREVLGEHVTQKGSLVTSERLRFDFSHFEAVSQDQITRIEKMVNDQVRLNSLVQTELLSMEQAQSKGAMALFGEKYEDEVRVLTMGNGFSIELCGGTHVTHTGDIGLCKIISEVGIAAGVRRIEAVTGGAALDLFNADEEIIFESTQLLKTNRSNILEKLSQLLEDNKRLEKEVQQMKSKMATSAGSDLAAKIEEVAGISVIAQKLEGVDRQSLLTMMDQLKNKLGTGVILLASVNGGEISLVAGVTKDLTGKAKAGDLMRHTAAIVGGKGGGRPDMAQGGGSDIAALDDALAAVKGWVSDCFD